MNPYRFIFQVSMTTIIVCVVYLLLHLLPFKSFVDIEYINYEDVCIGSDKQFVESKREVVWPIQAHVYAQVVKIEGVKVIETTINREDLFGYEESGIATLQIKWSEPFEEEGLYGVNSWIDMRPLPFITIKDFNSYKDNQFRVIDCGV